MAEVYQAELNTELRLRLSSIRAEDFVTFATPRIRGRKRGKPDPLRNCGVADLCRRHRLCEEKTRGSQLTGIDYCFDIRKVVLKKGGNRNGFGNERGLCGK